MTGTGGDKVIGPADADLRTFGADGIVRQGCADDSHHAALVLYLAGNQYMVVEELLGAYRRLHQDIGLIFVATLPPGELCHRHILKENGSSTLASNPDIYASTELTHLQRVRDAGLMQEYLVYTRNRLALMVAEDNPKEIEGPQDLRRTDLLQSHPNPITEGIGLVAETMLRELDLLSVVTAGRRAAGTWAIKDRTWLTARHHRETPDRIESGLADVGIVWATEIAQMRRAGRHLQGVEIPAPYDQSSRVAYPAGRLVTARNPENAARFLAFLASPAAQRVYESYGFVRANLNELILRAIP